MTQSNRNKGDGNWLHITKQESAIIMNSGQEGMESIICQVCNCYFSDKRILKRHIESVHENKKTYRCLICEYSCYEMKTLKVHTELVHEKKKLHICTICDWNFYLKGSLKSHMESVHEKKKKNYVLKLQLHLCSEKWFENTP